MQLIRYHHESRGARFGVVIDHTVYDLTEAKDPRVQSLAALLTSGEPVSTVAERIQAAVESAPGYEMYGLLDSGHQAVDGDEVRLLRPIDLQEVWAAGVTYKRSEEARKAESEGAAQFYGLVYDAPRPELFFKATPNRTVGAHATVGIRRDAKWNVPEPELGVVLTRELEILGYTVGNDMSSRDIEGENPLYLPQAKVYERSCALGPGITLATAVDDPHDLEIELRILRDGDPVFEGKTSTAEMKRKIPELISYLGRANTFPDGAVLLTGTGIVPDDDVSLTEGDVVQIAVASLGTLINTVQIVG